VCCIALKCVSIAFDWKSELGLVDEIGELAIEIAKEVLLLANVNGNRKRKLFFNYLFRTHVCLAFYLCAAADAISAMGTFVYTSQTERPRESTLKEKWIRRCFQNAFIVFENNIKWKSNGLFTQVYYKKSIIKQIK